MTFALGRTAMRHSIQLDSSSSIICECCLLADGNKYDLLDDAFVSLAEIAKRTDAAVIALSQPKAELEVGAVPTMRHLSYAGDKPSNRLRVQVAGGMGTRWRAWLFTF